MHEPSASDDEGAGAGAGGAGTDAGGAGADDEGADGELEGAAGAPAPRCDSVFHTGTPAIVSLPP